MAIAMECILMNCPQCGAELRIRLSVKQFACGTCGTGLKIETDGGIITLTVPLRDSVQGINQSTAKIASEMALSRLKQEHSAEVERLNKMTSRAVVGAVGQASIAAAGEVLASGVEFFGRVLAIMAGLAVVFASIIGIGLSKDPGGVIGAIFCLILGIGLIAVVSKHKPTKRSLPTPVPDPKVKEEIQAARRRIAEIEDNMRRHEQITSQ